MQQLSSHLKEDKRSFILEPNTCDHGLGTQIYVIPNSMFQYGKSLRKGKVINGGLCQMECQDCELAEGGGVGVSSL